MVIICAMDLVKLIMFAFIGFSLSEPPIVTLEDAIASFVSRSFLVAVQAANNLTSIPQSNHSTSTPVIAPTKKRRWAAATGRRWTFACLAFVAAQTTLVF